MIPPTPGAGFFSWRIAFLCLVLTLSLLTWPGKSTEAQEDPAPFGIVSIRVTSQSFDAILPWNKNSEESVQGNGAVLEGKRLVTTADLVKNANLLEVRKFGRYPDYPARAILIDYDLNLALLEVDDPEFWQELQPLPLADRPVSSGAFAINRWRASGRFERARGEIVDYMVSTSPFGLMEFPMMRGTTAMGGLGWGEVLTSSGRIIGMITSHGQQNFNAINSDMIKLLALAEAKSPKSNRETGSTTASTLSSYGSSLFAHRGFAWQRLNQMHLRTSLQLGDAETGILIRRIFPGGTGTKELHEGDILHRINGYDVDPEGRIDHPAYGRLLFSGALNETLDPVLQVEIQRDGQRMQMELERARFSEGDYRIDPPRYDRAKDYEVFGGLVLQELSLDYLRAWGKDWREKAPSRLVIEYSLKSLRDKEEKPEKVLIISKVLPEPSNLGYEDVDNTIIRQVNGRAVHSLEEFREAIAMPVEGYHLIDLMPGQGRGRLVYSAASVESTNARVKERYGIP